MGENIFKLEPKWPKCIWQIEHWKKNSEVIERVLWWRFGSVNDFSLFKSLFTISNSK